MSFPDKAIEYNNEVKHTLGERDERFKIFSNIPQRVFVTIGEHPVLKRLNREYRKELKQRQSFKFFKLLYKPHSGIFNLKKAARLKPEKASKTSGSGGHSQPGRLGMIAAILVKRSRKILSNAQNTIDAVYAAMLALQAQEILGGRTATLSIEAISLKHQAEVMAECMFYGVEHNFDVSSRFQEIKDELKIIGGWFIKSKKELMICNSQLNIINELARIFRRYSQFDEEQFCLKEVRKLSGKIYRKRNKYWGWFIHPVRWYFETLVGSLPKFLTAIFSWPIVFTLLYWAFGNGNPDSFSKAFTLAVNSFFALQVTVLKSGPAMPFLSIFATILGFFHLGIFISHLYTIVSRR